MRQRLPSAILIVPVVVLGVDLLTWGAAPGVGLALALLAFAGLLAVRFPAILGSLPGCAATVAASIATLAIACDAGPLPIACAMLSLAAMAIAGRSGGALDGAAFLARGAAGCIGLVVRPFADARLMARWRKVRTPARWRLAAWLLPGIFGSVFLGLFLAANPVLGDRLAALGGWFADSVAIPEPLRLACWWLAGVAGWGLLRCRWPRAREQQRIPGPHADRTGLVLRSLVVFNALFLLQNLSDAVYLWGGAALPEGMTYAHYAHRGAYPLIATALLAAVFVLAWFRPGSPVQADPWCRRLVIGWLVQNVALLVSAVWRLHLYVDVYGLTRWRVAAAVWMLLVAIGLGLMAWRIRRDLANRWLVNANLASVAAALLALGWCDVDGAIARHNVAHRGTGFDLAYLVDLGPASLPALSGLASEPEVDAAVARLRGQLSAELSDWRGWTVRRALWRPVADYSAR